jgi:hypothetical protein
MNTTTRRFPRTSQAEPWRGVITYYPRPLSARVWDAIFVTVLATSSAVGVFLYLSR